MNKNFLYGLSEMLNGIRVAFDPDLIKHTKINRGQFVRYILDNVEGLGKEYLFNQRGRHSFLNKIEDLEMNQLQVTARLLINPGNQVRTENKWTDLGDDGTVVRILAKRRHIGKDRIYFLYKVTEHNAYQAQLRTPPDRVAFSTA